MARQPRDLCTIAEAKRRLPNYQEPTDPAELARADALWADLVTSASDLIYEVSGREFLSALDPGTSGGNDWPTPPTETRIFDVLLNPGTPGGGRAAAVDVGDMQAVTAVGLSWQWATTYITPQDLALDPYVRLYPSPRAPGKPIRRLQLIGGISEGQRYHVTGKWGWPKVPMAIRNACASQAAIWASEDLANFSRAFLDVAAAGSNASEPRALAKQVYDVAFLYRIPTL